MKKLTISFLFFPLLIFSQINTAEYMLKPGESIFYFDDDMKKATKQQADYYLITKLDANGISANGAKTYYKSGELRDTIEKLIYLDVNDGYKSKLDGNYKQYYKSGNISREFNYSNDVRVGIQKTFYESGKLKSEWKASNGEVDGKYRQYYESGKIKVIGNWKMGIQLDYQSFHENGNTQITYKYENGKINGVWNSFHENGKRKQDAYFVDDKRDGLLRNFDINGNLSFIQKWEKGKKYFEETFYPSGSLKASYGLSDGVFDGEYISYHENGNIHENELYKDGKYVGFRKIYNKNGLLKSDEFWIDDKLNDWRFYDDSGELVFEVLDSKYSGFPNSEGWWVQRLNKDFEVIFEDSELEDQEIAYKRFMFFKNGKGYGESHQRIIMYYDNEQDMETYLYKESFIDENFYYQGKVNWYYENGNLEISANYVDDEREGYTYYYNEDGSFDKSVKYINGYPDYWGDQKCIDGDCEFLYESYFGSTDFSENQGWYFYDNENFNTFIPSSPEAAKNKYYFDNKSDGGNISSVRLPIEDNADFQASCTVNWWNGVDNSYFGLYVGYKDWDNYTALRITANGYYQARIKVKGIDIGMQEGEYVQNSGYEDPTTLNIIRIADQIFFSIDGKVVYTSDYEYLIGNDIGLYVSGKQSATFDNLKVVKLSNANYSNDDEYISRPDSGWVGNGSGFFISTNGHIATNYHVIEDTQDIEVEFLVDGETVTYNAEIVKSDKKNDLAIIKIKDSRFRAVRPIPYAIKSQQADVGQEVFALGYPWALSGMGKEIKFTDGRISARSGYDGDITNYQSTTPIQGGNSGGPLFDYNGNLIGINSSKHIGENVESVSYSIKSRYLISLIESLPVRLSIPSSTSALRSRGLVEQIKIISDFVVLIKTK